MRLVKRKRVWVMRSDRLNDEGRRGGHAVIFRGSDDVPGSPDDPYVQNHYQPTIAVHIPGFAWIGVVAVGGPKAVCWD